MHGLMAADMILHLVHLSVIAISLFAWIVPKTRCIHRVVLFATACSWLGGGMFWGIGYCFLTDWHWDVKRALGVTSLPSSYIQYLLKKIGWELSLKVEGAVIGSVFVTIVLITSIQIYRERLLFKSKSMSK